MNCLIIEFGMFTAGENHKHQEARIADVLRTCLPQPATLQ